MTLTKIPEFHPRVVKVDLLSGKTVREPGASYQCHLSGGKHSCIERDIEIIPLQKIVTVLPEDTFGISKILSEKGSRGWWTPAASRKLGPLPAIVQRSLAWPTRRCQRTEW
jgi:hypothetical protein